MDLTIITDAINQLINGPAWLLVMAAVIAVGYVVKLIPFVSNKYIPLVCCAFGTIFLPLLSDPKTQMPGRPHPYISFALLGFVLSLVSWLFHGVILKPLEAKFKLFQPDPETPKT